MVGGNRDILASFGFCRDSGHATQNWDCPGKTGTSGDRITSDKKAWQATQQKCAFDNNVRATLTLNFDVKYRATKYHPAGLNWPPGREFETPAIQVIEEHFLQDIRK